MAHTLEIRCTVTNPDGFYYREAHEWANLPDIAIQWFDANLADLMKTAQELASKGKGDHAAEFVQIRDGEALAAVVTGLSYKDVVKMQRAFARKEAELLDIADGRTK
jgi:hypothetical protein